MADKEAKAGSNSGAEMQIGDSEGMRSTNVASTVSKCAEAAVVSRSANTAQPEDPSAWSYVRRRIIKSLETTQLAVEALIAGDLHQFVSSCFNSCKIKNSLGCYCKCTLIVIALLLVYHWLFDYLLWLLLPCYGIASAFYWIGSNLHSVLATSDASCLTRRAFSYATISDAVLTGLIALLYATRSRQESEPSISVLDLFNIYGQPLLALSCAYLYFDQQNRIQPEKQRQSEELASSQEARRREFLKLLVALCITRLIAQKLFVALPFILRAFAGYLFAYFGLQLGVRLRQSITASPKNCVLAKDIDDDSFAGQNCLPGRTASVGSARNLVSILSNKRKARQRSTSTSDLLEPDESKDNLAEFDNKPRVPTLEVTSSGNSDEQKSGETNGSNNIAANISWRKTVSFELNNSSTEEDNVSTSSSIELQRYCCNTPPSTSTAALLNSVHSVQASGEEAEAVKKPTSVRNQCRSKSLSIANGPHSSSSAEFLVDSGFIDRFDRPSSLSLLGSSFGEDGHSLPHPPNMSARNRRVSLPVGQLAQNKIISQAQNNVSEARGLLADMLAWKDIPPNVFSGLKAVNSLLNPHHINATLDVSQLVPRFAENPLTGDLSASLRSTINLRNSPITWSTVTSATGLPTVELEPSKARSSSSFSKLTKDERENNNNNATNAPSIKRHSFDVNGEQLNVIKVSADNSVFDCSQLQKDDLLALVSQWHFPIFTMAARAPKTLLSHIAYKVFYESNLLKVFKIQLPKFFSCMHAIERGYRDVPYHNRLHASDVLQAAYYLTVHDVSAFSEQSENKINQLPTADKRRSLASVLSPLELMALYTACAMHDYDHPARTNAFLVATKDPKAILYNDRSVLENYHAASSWQVMSKAENFFLDALDDAEFKRFRYLVLELILATDLKRHFEILAEFSGKVNGDGLDWNDESDRLLAMIMIIKMSDINAPCRSKDLHLEWTSRIVEEFYQQGDEEKSRGLPVSNYMDRNSEQVAMLQDSFIAHLITPLVDALNDAELLHIAEGEDIPVLQKNLEENHKLWTTDSPNAAKKDNPSDTPAVNEMQSIQEEQEQDNSSLSSQG